MNLWESIFLQSRANDGWYGEEDLPQSNWEWPKETWFQARLDYVREHQWPPRVNLHRKPVRPSVGMRLNLGWTN